MNRVFRRAFSTTGRVLAEAEAAAAEATELRLNLAVPARALISGAEVARVTLPGRAGRFGVEKSSPSMLAELRPGVVNVIHLDGRSEDFFVPGGFAFVHGDNRIDVSTPEGVRVEDLDADRVREMAAISSAKRDSTAAGTKDHAKAVVELEVYKEIGRAVGVNL
ncbi:hypothetical protein FNF27_06287 [Cafeteria roenbergensis]|uniref:ATP synthase F1 complex delta/epsilon subunit N-terminal domain-containing protein n=1 Tax=Cafeteria roenbergensis TaxID=33653 RepID=A0A5A8C6A5_CAFRO|nr:hypothetical protein FNF29_07247 [Cafeteria roenbergensis]KAA0162114.1 hypothetical protein FNF28_04818 [Cafeteria roenbergensis]KAA0167089.1 hypothetical protein FNF31_00975 [Cafeteria roenbergensis]KAA0171577.1 hypothetical protein FNF27_06287 [Cafeteria roenbergensis]|eukprot:KAA0147600.1 hypothetical protein FNF29_07247 [Cafeteria roenbergensis]